MKISVSLPGADVEFLDTFAAEQGLASRSAAVQQAVRLMRVAELRTSYESAWAEANEDAEVWDSTVGDGLADGAPG